MAIIGIDLGTTNSLAAVWRNGCSELIPNAMGEYLTPSVVSMDDDGTVLVGRAARDRLITHPTQSAARFKRYMGTDHVFTLGSRSYRAEELSAVILRSLCADAERYLGEPVEEAVVSVPAYFAQAQRAATKRAGRLAGVKVERLINEPSAAALAGRIDAGDEDRMCLVFDLGGGTLDVSLVERFSNVVSITAVSGDNRLGGIDFDAAIAKGFCEECGVDFAALSDRQQQMLLRQAELCKMALTTRDPVFMAVDDDGVQASLLLSNEWMIRKCSALFRRMIAPIRHVLSDAGISPDDLDDLVLVGGSAHMPSVQRYISRTLGMKLRRGTNPDTAIARGVGIYAGMKSRATDLRDMVLTDVCPFTLGTGCLNHADPNHDLMAPIIERNSVLPTSKEETFYTVSDRQKKVEVRIYQGERRLAEENTLLGKTSLNVPPAPAGTQSVRIRFSYDINGLLEVDVMNEVGGKSHLLIRSDDMDDAEVQRRLTELAALKRHPQDDERVRAVQNRCEALYAATTGELRSHIHAVAAWLEQQIKSQEQIRIARALLSVERFCDAVEAQVGEIEPPDEEWYRMFSPDDDDGWGAEDDV